MVLGVYRDLCGIGCLQGSVWCKLFAAICVVLGAYCDRCGVRCLLRSVC